MSKFRAVLAGCGGIAGAWMDSPTAKEQFEMVGFVDISLKNAQDRAAKYGVPGAIVGEKLAPVLKQVKPDVVFDCSIPDAHYEITMTALKHGCHVLGEKPLADTMAHAKSMVAMAKKVKKTYAVIQNRRYQPQIRSLRKFLDSGAIGKVHTVQSNFFLGPHFGGFRDVMDHVLLLDMSIHTFDAARFITAADPVAVYCHEWNPSSSWYKHGASAFATFEMTKGIVYSYQGSWCAEGCSTTWEADWRIIGEKGSLLWNGGDMFKAEVMQPASEGKPASLQVVEVPVQAELCPATGHNGVLHAFAEALRAKKVPETISSDNIKSLAMVHGAIRSAEQKKRVKI